MKGEDTSCLKTEWELPEGQENEVPPAPLMPKAKGRESGETNGFLWSCHKAGERGLKDSHRGERWREGSGYGAAEWGDSMGLEN